MVVCSFCIIYRKIAVFGISDVIPSNVHKMFSIKNATFDPPRLCLLWRGKYPEHRCRSLQGKSTLLHFPNSWTKGKDFYEKTIHNTTGTLHRSSVYADLHTDQHQCRGISR